MNRKTVVPILLLPVALAACSSGSSPTASSSPKGSVSSSGPMPAVTHATDLHVAPGISRDAYPAPTKLLTKDLVVGTGTTATAASTVAVQYVGASYTTGKVFNSTWQEGGKAVPFSLSEVIPGFAQGIEGMKVGGRREIVIPSALGYGAAGSPPAVAPNETLVFVVDLISVH